MRLHCVLALVFLWTLSPDKLETTPVWHRDSHTIGLQLKVPVVSEDGGGEFAPLMEGDASRDREQMRRGTTQGQDRVVLPPSRSLFEASAKAGLSARRRQRDSHLQRVAISSRIQ